MGAATLAADQRNGRSGSKSAALAAACRRTHRATAHAAGPPTRSPHPYH